MCTLTDLAYTFGNPVIKTVHISKYCVFWFCPAKHLADIDFYIKVLHNEVIFC